MTMLVRERWRASLPVFLTVLVVWMLELVLAADLRGGRSEWRLPPLTPRVTATVDYASSAMPVAMSHADQAT